MIPEPTLRPARVSTRLALATAMLLLAAGTAASAPERATSDSVHYHLLSSGQKAEADEWARVLEAAWPEFVEFFGKAPALGKGERLNVAFFETDEDMRAAIRRAGGTPPTDAGGYYDPVSRTAYAWRQPSAWYTRTLILHECAHQFHRLGRVAEKVTPPAWYGEGVAEHLSHHTWDGERLRLGVVPMLSLENRPAEALATVKASTFSLDALIDGTAAAGRPESMHLVRYLCQGDGGKLRAKFDDLAAAMDRGGKVGSTNFTRAFGPSKKLLASLTQWLETVQEPWESLFVEWDSRSANALRGTAPVMATCRRRAETRRLSVRVRPVGDGSWKGGLLLQWGGPEDCVVALLENGTRLKVNRRARGGWHSLADVEAPAAENGSWRMEAVRESGAVKVLVNGQEVANVEAASGSMGLALDSCTVDFTEIEAK